MDLGIAGRVALVTGASQGIGRQVAFELAREGATVALNARNPESLSAAAEEVRSAGSSVTTHVADVSRADAVARLVAEVQQQSGPIDILVVNAGGPPTGQAASLGDDAWVIGYELTLMSAVRLAREVLSGMRARRFGRIVNITSLAVRAPIARLTLSNAFRAAVTGFAKTLSSEVAAEGVTVNNVAPGYTATERLDEVVADDEARQALLASIPAQRLATATEIAAAVAFLASQRAGYITGQTLLVDGGAVGSVY